MEIEQTLWGMTADGEAIVRYKMVNARGEWAEVMNLGATLTGVTVADREGKMADVVLGYERWESYRGDGPYMGKSVGRYANRIGGARFELEGEEIVLAPNEKQNILHGGAVTLANKIWEARVEGNRVVFAVESEAGEGGFPGRMAVEAAYHFSDEGELEIVYTAVTDAATAVNLTNHAYFNLAGGGSVLGHELWLKASRFLPTRADGIPTGEIWDVAGTPMDFREWKALGAEIDADYGQIADGAGYDRCWVVDGWEKNILAEVGELRDEVSGRKMTVLTSQPGVQIYTGNYLQGSPTGKTGKPYSNRDGVAIECQGWPDAPNHANFPSQTLRPGERYLEKIVYRFTAE